MRGGINKLAFELRQSYYQQTSLKRTQVVLEAEESWHSFFVGQPRQTNKKHRRKKTKVMSKKTKREKLASSEGVECSARHHVQVSTILLYEVGEALADTRRDVIITMLELS